MAQVDRAEDADQVQIMAEMDREEMVEEDLDLVGKENEPLPKRQMGRPRKDTANDTSDPDHLRQIIKQRDDEL